MEFGQEFRRFSRAEGMRCVFDRTGAQRPGFMNAGMFALTFPTKRGEVREGQGSRLQRHATGCNNKKNLFAAARRKMFWIGYLQKSQSSRWLKVLHAAATAPAR